MIALYNIILFTGFAALSIYLYKQSVKESEIGISDTLYMDEPGVLKDANKSLINK